MLEQYSVSGESPRMAGQFVFVFDVVTPAVSSLLHRLFYGTSGKLSCSSLHHNNLAFVWHVCLWLFCFQIV